MMMSVGQSVENLAGEPKVVGENLAQFRFVYHKCHITWPGLEQESPVEFEVQQCCATCGPGPVLLGRASRNSEPLPPTNDGLPAPICEGLTHTSKWDRVFAFGPR
jgi:hypothetical protein